MNPARQGLVLLSCVALSWAVVATTQTSTLVPAAWPASGLLAGLLLTAPEQRRRDTLLVLGLLSLILAQLLAGTAPALAIGFAASSALEAWIVHWVLTRTAGARRPALLHEGDVSRTIGAIAVGASAGAVGYGLTDLVSGSGTPWLGVVAVIGTHAASLMVILPFFLETPPYPALAPLRERVVQWVVTLGTTTLLFTSTSLPPAVFVVMPMFAWLGFRGTLREASLLLTAVGALATTMTVLHIGPVWALEGRYDLPPELVIGFLQLLLLDCGLILLPLSVAIAQQRAAAAGEANGKETLERLIASATGTAIVATDREGRIIVFNPGASAMLGYSRDEVLGESPERFHTQAELARHAVELGCARFEDICRMVSASDEPRRLWRYRRKDGVERTVLMTLATVPDHEGNLAGYLSTAEDVTEREEAQAALVAALEHQATAVDKLRELDQIKSDVVSTVSHELRTPITSILGFTELLEDGAVGALTDGQRDLVERIDRNGHRLLGLIENLLMLSDVESLNVDAEPGDLRQVVTAAHDAVRPLLAGRRLVFTLDVPDEPVDFEGDSVALGRAIHNLLTNAIKFTQDGGRVGVRLTASEHVAEVVVIDTGVGIPEEDREQLFTRFYRSATATERAIQGTGLGLAIVQHIVTRHGGTVSIHSSPGRGTKASITLPRTSASTPKSAPPGARPEVVSLSS